MTIKIDERGRLSCKNCGGTKLTQTIVDVFDRKEDAESGMHISVSHEQARTDQQLKGNPSAHGKGVNIGLKCNSCEHFLVLSIYEYSGSMVLTTEVNRSAKE